jgi:competence protein ComEA
MPEISRAQIVVYGAIAVALLLVGARAIRGEGGAETSFAAGAPSGASSGGGSGGSDFAISGEAGDVVVDVTGAVAEPGVYRLPAGSRVDDAVQRAGGAEDGPISLGTATVEQLDTIEGIGPVTAEDIIAFRDENGGLASVDQLDQVSGIGPATMEALRSRLQP